MRAGSRAFELLRCSHPEPVIAVTALAGTLAVAIGRGLGSLWVVAAVLTGQLFVGWTNDYADAGLDASQGRTDKPVAAGRIAPATVRNAAALALLLCVPLSLASGLAAGLTHLAAVGIATLYNLKLKVTVASVIPYAASFALLPAFISMGLPGNPLPARWVLAAGGLLGAGAHFTQSLPDVGADREQGLGGLPVRFGERGSALAAAALLLGAMSAITFGPGRPSPPALIALGVTGVLAVVIVSFAYSGRPLAAFRLTMVFAALAVGALVLSGRTLVS